jgi:hypothetical protein
LQNNNLKYEESIGVPFARSDSHQLFRNLLYEPLSHRKARRKHERGRTALLPKQSIVGDSPRKVGARGLMDMVSIDRIHLLVRIRKKGSGNITVVSLEVFVLASSRLWRVVNWRGTFLGLISQLQSSRL